MFFNNNNNWFYNPNCFNQQTYYENQQEIQRHINMARQQQYENEQYSKIIKAAHAFEDFLTKKNDVDQAHQPELAAICLDILAKHQNWHLQ